MSNLAEMCRSSITPLPFLLRNHPILHRPMDHQRQNRQPDRDLQVCGESCSKQSSNADQSCLLRCRQRACWCRCRQLSRLLLRRYRSWRQDGGRPRRHGLVVHRLLWSHVLRRLLTLSPRGPALDLGLHLRLGAASTPEGCLRRRQQTSLSGAEETRTEQSPQLVP